MLVGLYILTPVLRKFVERAEDDEVRFVLNSLFIVAFLIPTVNKLFNLQITTFYLGERIFSYTFYFLIGYYIGNKHFKNYKYIYILGIIGFFGFLLLCILNYKFDIDKGNLNVFTCLYSILIFSLFSSGKLKIPMNGITKNISKYSFGIYIMHVFWLNLLYKGLHIYPNRFPIFCGEFGFWIIDLILSFVSAFIIAKIPIIKKLFV